MPPGRGRGFWGVDLAQGYQSGEHLGFKPTTFWWHALTTRSPSRPWNESIFLQTQKMSTPECQDGPYRSCGYPVNAWCCLPRLNLCCQIVTINLPNLLWWVWVLSVDYEFHAAHCAYVSNTWVQDVFWPLSSLTPETVYESFDSFMFHCTL